MTKEKVHFGLAAVILCVVLSWSQHVSGGSCPEPVFDNSTFVDKPVTFVRVSPTSKYLYPKDVFTAGAKYGMRICRDLGLQVATVNCIDEYWQVVNEVVDGKKLRKSDGKMALLVAGHLKRKGQAIATYVNPKSKEQVPFQMFNFATNKYFEKGWECMVMECDKKNCYYLPKHHKTGDPAVIPFCQYPKDSECYKEGVKEPENLDEIPQIGETKERIYYGSKIQKSRDDAMEACKKGGMKLLSFFKKDTEETTAVMKLLSDYRATRKSPDWHEVTWTSGKFVREFSSKSYFDFESTDDQWEYADNKGHWEWSTLVNSKDEELCMAVVSSKAPHEVRPIVCDMPNYFVCFKSKSGGQGGRTFKGTFDVVESEKDGADEKKGDGADLNKNEKGADGDKKDKDDKDHKGDGDGDNKDGGANEEEEKICKEAATNACTCRTHAFCRFDGAGGGCVHANNFCKTLKFEKDECARPKGFYSLGGAVCQNPASTEGGTCKPVKTVLAVNIGGDDHTDEKGVKYISQDKSVFEDPFKLQKTGPCEEKPKITGVPEKDKKLYETHMWGEGREVLAPNSDMCVTYRVPAKEDGDYELALKTQEGFQVDRSFNVKFNGLKVLLEVNVTQYSGGIGRAIDFLVNYRVSEKGTKLTLKGYPDTQIICEQVPLQFCMGGCKASADSLVNFRMSAFSVQKMKDAGKD